MLLASPAPKSSCPVFLIISDIILNLNFMESIFNPKVGGKVSREEAEKWMKKFDDERHDKKKDTKSVFFGKDFLQEIINTPDAAGVSFFFVKKYNPHFDKDTLDIVMVPRKADGTLLWASSSDGKDGGQSGYDNSAGCPPYC
jgi:hypothetical protein